jgi:hypothetical protein
MTDIAAADADVGNADEDVVGVLDSGDGMVFESCVSGAVEETGRVLRMEVLADPVFLY